MTVVADDRSDRACMLRRISGALGQPVEAMLMANDGIGDRACPSAAETDALMAAFSAVTNPEARRRIIRAVEAEARGAVIT